MGTIFEKSRRSVILKIARLTKILNPQEICQDIFYLYLYTYTLIVKIIVTANSDDGLILLTSFFFLQNLYCAIGWVDGWMDGQTDEY